MGKITDYCTGCRACEQLCSHGAISLMADREGFLQAIVDTTKCVECGLCVKRCPQNTPVTRHEPLRVLAARYKDKRKLQYSASGGAFVGMAISALHRGGVVFGVAYDKEWNARHVLVTTVNGLGALQSSKYVQADTRESYRLTKQILNEGKLVLYSGTGCQIAGLKSFLRRDYENLLTMDLICHGVSSPLLFKKYIDWQEKNLGGKVLFYNFRDKTEGWGLGYKYKIKTSNRTR